MSKTVPMIAISKSTRALHLRAVLDIHCSCAQCIPQATERECVCCRELEDVLSIFSHKSVRLTCIVDHPEFATVCLTCIVDHPEFATVCLNPLVLRVALAGTIGLQFWLRRCVTLNANEIFLAEVDATNSRIFLNG